MTTEIKEGWTWLINAAKWHYFVDGKSLCGRWARWTNTDLEQGNDDSPNNCATCQKKLKARQAKAAKAGTP